MDLDGNTRPHDGDGNGSALTDMGAYEYVGSTDGPGNEVWVNIAWAGSAPGDPVGGHTFAFDAFATISDGINAAEAPDTVHVASGTYIEQITLRDQVILSGAGSASTVIDADNAVGPTVRVSGVGAGTVIEGFKITGGTGKVIGIYTYGGGFYVWNSTVTIRNNLITQNYASDGAGGIQAMTSTVTLENNTISNNDGWWGSGIASNDSHFTIKRSVFTNNTCNYGGCIWLGAGSDGLIENTLIYGNDTVGIGIDDGSNANLVNNTIANNAGGAYAKASGSGTITNCIIWGNGVTDLGSLTATYSNIEGGFAGAGNIGQTPLFADPASGDFRLTMQSPCIDTGTLSGAPAVDLDGNTRPHDGDGNGSALTDMGAYEYVGSTDGPGNEVWVNIAWAGSAPGDPVGGHTFAFDAFATISDGINAAEAPDTVHVASGTYIEQIALRDQVTLSGAGSASTVIDANGAAGPTVTVSGVGAGTVIEGFKITGGTGKVIGIYTYGGAFYVSNSTVTIRNNHITQNESSDGAGGIQTLTSTVTLENNTIENNEGWWGAALASNDSQLIIERNVITNNTCNYGGFIWLGAGCNGQIENNLIYGNNSTYGGGVPGVGIDDNSHADLVNNTIVYNPGAVGCKAQGSGTITNCIIWSNGISDLSNLTATYSNLEDGTTGEGNICQNPLFADPAGGDFHLTMQSRCIDTGTLSGAPAVDLDGNTRP
ncbi:right-handed parallel beta-helix repeat-containing protein, partial [Planctomycetota bacterium]